MEIQYLNHISEVSILPDVMIHATCIWKGTMEQNQICLAV